MLQLYQWLIALDVTYIITLVNEYNSSGNIYNEREREKELTTVKKKGFLYWKFNS